MADMRVATNTRPSFYLFFILLPAVLAIWPGPDATVSAQVKIRSAVCENRPDPAGVPLHRIRFAWVLDGSERGLSQSAWQVVVGSDSGRLANGVYDGWNSSRVIGQTSQSIYYNGRPLKPGQAYYWRVRVWDNQHRASGWSRIHRFITGLFEPADWAGARWIGYEDIADSQIVSPGIHFPYASGLGSKCLQKPVTPLFRKDFSTNGKKIRSAFVFISGLGQYEMTLNGQKVGDGFLDPGWTYYDKECLYNVYDVTGQLSERANTIGVIVGNGFYNINRERYFKMVDAFGMPKLICRLRIEFADGNVSDIVSDDSWMTAPSPTVFNSIYGGEDYDARLEQPRWDSPGFDTRPIAGTRQTADIRQAEAGSNWEKALFVKPPTGRLLPASGYPVQLTDTLTVKKIRYPKPGITIYDFGQNASGIVEIRVQGQKGQRVKLIPAELLDTQGLANQSASGHPFYFSYTMKGEGIETWRPRFSYYGFRYVQVEGLEPSGLKEITLLHNQNANPSSGSFTCSNELFNRVFALINWAIKSNMQSILTDCPHREKLSWLEQDYLMGESVHYNFDIFHLYTKLVSDIIDAQTPEGLIPDIAPEFVVFQGGFRDSPEWGSAGVILPWLLYKWYGDKDILERAYPMMKKYVEYLKKTSQNGILPANGLGDWFDYGPGTPGFAQLTPRELTATAIYYYDIHLLSETAAALGYGPDADHYKTLAQQTREIFNTKFFDPKKKVYSTGSQTAMAMPLCLGLAEPALKKAILTNLVDSINKGNKALTAGDIGFHFLVSALDEGGASQLLFDMNARDDVPGYGFQLKKGATALTESWPALENVSNNHLMLGHLMEWFYSGLAGIGQAEGSVAYKDIVIRPEPVGDIGWASGTFESPYGLISSSWKKKGGHFTLDIKIPVNTQATVFLPASDSAHVWEGRAALTNRKDCRLIGYKDGKVLVRVGSGEYVFETDTNWQKLTRVGEN